MLLGITGIKRPLGERTVTDLAPLRRTDPARLARRERREVVVVHVAACVSSVIVSSICSMRGMPKRHDRQHLRLAPLEQARYRARCRARRPRPTAAGCRPGPRPSMRTPSLTMRPTHHFLLQRTERPLHLTRLLGVRAGLVDGADEADRSSDEDLVELALRSALSAIVIAAAVVPLRRAPSPRRTRRRV